MTKLLSRFKGGGKGGLDTYRYYSNAVDSSLYLPDWMIYCIDMFNNKTGLSIPTGASNCTLHATNGKYSKANTIINGVDNYVEHDGSNLKAGDLIIATNPENNAHHTMTYVGRAAQDQKVRLNDKVYQVNKGDVIVDYSNGSTYKGSRHHVPLNAYIDQSHGKTKLQYFRPK